MFLSIATIFFCQVVLYFETRRHEKEIVSQQVSVEAREKFITEKKLLNWPQLYYFSWCLAIYP